MHDLIRDAFWTSIWLLAGVSVLSWGPQIPPTCFGIEAVPFKALLRWSFPALGLLLLLQAAVTFPKWELALLAQTLSPDDPQLSQKLYGRFLVFTGYLLILLTLAATIALTGMMNAGIFSAAQWLKMGMEGKTVLSVLALSTGMALLGSVFFTANALLERRSSGGEPFDESQFWGGFWFRMGESMLFVVVFFLVALGLDPESQNALLRWLPALGLLLGMFVKSGEQLVFGVSERVFASVRALIPTGASGRETLRPGRPRNLRAARVDADAVFLTWDEPLTGGAVLSYEVLKRRGGVDVSIAETPAVVREARILGEPPTEDLCYLVRARNGLGNGEPGNGVPCPS